MREEAERKKHFVAAVMAGEEAIKTGKTLPYPPQLMEQIKQDLVKEEGQ